MTPSPFSESLRFYREQAGLTLPALAGKSGVNLYHLYKCEAGKVRRPLEGTLRSLADALGIPAGRLLEPPPAPRTVAGSAPEAAAAPCPLPPPVAAGQGEHLPPPPPSGPAAGGGSQTPGSAVEGSPRALPGATLAERQQEQLAAIRSARSALAKDKRNRRARPWQGRDPFRNAVPGARKMPPGGAAS